MAVRLGFAHLVEDASTCVHIGDAGLRQGKRARRAVQQSGLEMGLEVRHLAADGRRGTPRRRAADEKLQRRQRLPSDIDSNRFILILSPSGRKFSDCLESYALVQGVGGPVVVPAAKRRGATTTTAPRMARNENLATCRCWPRRPPVTCGLEVEAVANAHHRTELVLAGLDVEDGVDPLPLLNPLTPSCEFSLLSA